MQWSDCQQTVSEMMGDRGYHQQKPLVGTTGNNFAVREAVDGDGGSCFAHFIPENKLGIKTLRNIMDKHEQNPGFKSAIIVCRDGATSFTNKKMIQGNLRDSVCVFKAEEVVKNITKHSYVPRHRACGTEEIEELIATHHLENKHFLPKLSCSDPVCRYYKFAPGQVVCIDRTNHCQEQQCYYRLVIENDS